MPTDTAAVMTAAFVAGAAARGDRPPLSISGAGSRGWVLVPKGPASRGGDALVLDEFGDLWWCRLEGKWSARVTRKVWREEEAALLESIRLALAQK